MKNFRSQHRPKKNSLIVGKRAILEAIQQGKQIDRLYLQSNGYKDMLEEMRKIAMQNAIPVNYVPIEKLNNFNVADHGGCVALISKVKYQDIQQIISWVVDKGEVPLFLILDGITDIRNIGGIARTAFCTGVQAIIIPDKGIGALNQDAILTSAGALEKIPICRVNSLLKTIDELHLNGIKVFASEMTASKNIFDMDFKEPVAIVMGSEEKGIYPALIKACDERFKIPMSGDFESLNVSVATGVILYEVMKKRNFNVL
ncbi:MAG: 23S rRNA (guanosine(2251)-2'-O)-methyltransferase RlmB [Bacteroidota bacterium]|nr:23S rRNA (guanosine(2251)-2'-O)-methyltransferase RlmB [Bacteroidota bacterium]